METPAFPANEEQRLWSLQKYQILDTEPEAQFDQLAELAANICEAPIALLSLVDHSRQWFKARIGIDATETARSVSFCAHAILQPKLFIVNDTLKDHRFCDNPLVLGPPYIRFYAGAPLFDQQGHGLGTLCVIDYQPRSLNSNQEKSLEALRNHLLKLFELRLKTQKLAELNHELNAYSYAISHDLGAPVRAINGFSGILLEEHGKSLDNEQLELVTRINNSGQRMKQLIDDLLYLSRVTRTPIDIGQVDLGELSKEIITSLTQADQSRKVEVIIQPNLVTNGDRRLLRIALENLLSNAWKFTSKTDNARIEIGVEKAKGVTQFFIRDNGAGFDMNYVDKLFKPFQRLHSNSEYPGSGIGLTTVRRIIERHNGKVWAAGEINQGAIFRFTLVPSTSELH